MTIDESPRRGRFSGPIWIVLGFVVLFLAWSLPVNLKSISPALLRESGQGTPSLAQFGQQLVDSEKIGSAQLVLAAAKTLKDPGAPKLEQNISALAARQPGVTAWGGWDPFLDPLFKINQAGGPQASTPVLDFFLPEKARATLADYLVGSRSLGVQSLLKTRDITVTGSFVPAKKAGGQPLDAVILLTSLLYQGEHLSPSLQRQLRTLADTANQNQALGELEPVYLDLLSLSKRLNWGQLSELLRRTDNAKTVGEYAHLARVDPQQLPIIYSAALFSDSADRVAAYLIQFGKTGLADLRLAVTNGQGAVRQLMTRQVPVNHSLSPALGATASLALLHPQLMLVLKYLAYLLGAYFIFRGLDRTLFANDAKGSGALPHVKSGVLAVLFGVLLILVTEPHLLQAAPLSEYRFRLVLPALATTSQAPATPSANPIPAMDTSTIISIGFFAALQVAMYLICLVKIRDISRMDVSPLVKLRLMENEENLFDGGLYVGIGGTATALVLQVLHVIDPNLLAAYSSNLFGITCVALVKIRHVRPYKRQLIIESQAVPAVLPTRL